MAKHETVSLPDETHAQIEELAEKAGLSVQAWLVAAVEREAFRQVCEKTNQWWKEHPEEAARATEDFHLREECRTEIHRGSSAA